MVAVEKWEKWPPARWVPGVMFVKTLWQNPRVASRWYLLQHWDDISILYLLPLKLCTLDGQDPEFWLVTLWASFQACLTSFVQQQQKKLSTNQNMWKVFRRPASVTFLDQTGSCWHSVSNVFGSPYSRESQYFLFSCSWPHKEELLLVVGITQLLSHVV